jgi:transposase
MKAKRHTEALRNSVTMLDGTGGHVNIMQHANAAVDEVRRAEFFRKGGQMRGVVKGKRWLLLSRWVNLDSGKRRELNTLFALNRRVLKAYLLKESLDRLWTYHYEGAMLRYLQNWLDQLLSRAE